MGEHTCAQRGKWSECTEQRQRLLDLFSSFLLLCGYDRVLSSPLLAEPASIEDAWGYYGIFRLTSSSTFILFLLIFHSHCISGVGESGRYCCQLCSA